MNWYDWVGYILAPFICGGMWMFTCLFLIRRKWLFWIAWSVGVLVIVVILIWYAQAMNVYWRSLYD
jgi:hypothetical protein